MAKTESPLMSFSASGSIGQRLVFSERASGSQARFQRKQKDKITAPRIVERDRYSASVQTWNEMTFDEQQVFVVRAILLQMTGYNLFMKEALPDIEGDLGGFDLGFSFLGLA